MILSKKSVEAIEALRESAPVASSFTDASRGCWVGGRLFHNEFGEPIFIPIGTSRSEIGVAGPLTFLGDALMNVKGWGDKSAPVSGRQEVRLVAPVEGV